MKEQFFLEQAVVKVVGGPVDLDAAALTGARVDMAKFKRVTFLIAAAAGTTPSAHEVTLRQHDAASAGNSKNLEVDNPWYHRVATADKYTKVEPTSKAAVYDIDTVVGDTKFEVAFEVLQEDLDINNGFRWVSLNIGDVGRAQLGAVIAICHNATEKPAYEKVV